MPFSSLFGKSMEQDKEAREREDRLKQKQKESLQRRRAARAERQRIPKDRDHELELAIQASLKHQGRVSPPPRPDKNIYYFNNIKPPSSLSIRSPFSVPPRRVSPALPSSGPGRQGSPPPYSSMTHKEEEDLDRALALSLNQGSPPQSPRTRKEQEDLDRALALSLNQGSFSPALSSSGPGRQRSSSRSGSACGIDRSQLPNRAMPGPRMNIRHGPYRMVNVSGDGNCFFYSVIAIFRHNGLLEQLKTCMLRDARQFESEGDINAELFRILLAYGIIHKGLGNTYLSYIYRDHLEAGEEAYNNSINAEDAAEFPHMNEDGIPDRTRPVINFEKLIFPPFAIARNMQYNAFKNYVAERISAGKLYVDHFENKLVEEYLNNCPFMRKKEYKVDFSPRGDQRDNTFTFNRHQQPLPNNKTLYIVRRSDYQHYNYIITPFALNP